MRPSLIPLDKELIHDLECGVVVTATARQAAELAYAYNREKSKRKDAWTGANAISFGIWIANSYESIALRGWNDAERALLSSEAARQIVRKTAPNEHIVRHASLLLNAWISAWEWNLWDVWEDVNKTENGRLCCRWVERFRGFLRTNALITAAEIPWILIRAANECIWRPSPITVYGFDYLTPAQRQIFNIVERYTGHVRIAERRYEKSTSAIKIFSFDSHNHELAAIANWTRTELMNHPTKPRIGVILNDASILYRVIRRQFEATFPEFDNVEQIVNIRQGMPATDSRFIRDSLLFLSWTAHELDYREVLQLRRSPYLQDLELQEGFPSRSKDRFSLRQYVIRTPQNSNIRKISKLLINIGRRKKPLSDWISLAAQLLRMAGWHKAEGTSSAGKDRVVFIDSMNTAVTVSAHLGNLSWSEAVSIMHSVVGNATLPETTTFAPILVTSPAESKYFQFDSLWVAGVSDKQFPAPSNPNAMIPISMQRQARMRNVTHDDMLEDTKAYMDCWLSSTNTIVFSLAQDDEETPLQASKLVLDAAHIESAELVPDPSDEVACHPWAQYRQTDCLQRYTDDEGSPLDLTLENGRPSNILRDQSNCPFRSWAIHRLNLREPEKPHRFPVAKDFGTNIHKILEELTKTHRSQQEMTKITKKEIHEIVKKKLQRSLKNLPAIFKNSEIERLVRNIESWIKFEINREPFEIIGIEQKKNSEVLALPFNLRFDRIDKLENGAKLILDYKTGNVTKADWKTPRPVNPQLPLYAIIEKDANGIAFLLINSEEVTFSGIGDGHIQEPGISATQQGDKTRYPELLEHWRSSLEELIVEFIEGNAKVSPKSLQFCNQCHLHQLCRIFEIS